MKFDTVITILAAVLSSGGLWGGLQFIVGRRAEADRKVEDEKRKELEREERFDERRQLLSDAQNVAQKTALDSNDRTIERINLECKQCWGELHKLREAAEDLIDVLEVLLDHESPEHRLRVRVSIRAMRQVL